MALLVKSDGTIAVTLPHDGSEFTLKELQTFVGGHIEVLKIHGSIAGYEGEFEMMVCNEDGIALGLPVNMIATAFYMDGGIDLARPDVAASLVLGDVLLCKHGEVS